MYLYKYRDDHVEVLKKKIEENEIKNKENKDSLGLLRFLFTFENLGNIQLKIIDIEKASLK